MWLLLSESSQIETSWKEIRNSKGMSQMINLPMPVAIARGSCTSMIAPTKVARSKRASFMPARFLVAKLIAEMSVPQKSPCWRIDNSSIPGLLITFFAADRMASVEGGTMIAWPSLTQPLTKATSKHL